MKSRKAAEARDDLQDLKVHPAKESHDLLQLLIQVMRAVIALAAEAGERLQLGSST